MFVSIIIVLGLSLLGLASPQPEKRARAQVITHCTVPNTAALTFDDGPYIYLYNISKILKAKRAVGTFFFNGNNFGCIYNEDNIKRVKYAYDNGHQVASHTWGHKDLTTLSQVQINDEMWRVEQALQRITGASPAFMRPPFGHYNNLVLDVSGARGQAVAIWDFDSGDSVGASVAKQKSNYNAIATRRPSTILALSHEHHASAVFETLPYAITRLQSAGYKLVTLAECLGKPAYKNVVAPSSRTAAWKC